MGLSRDDAGKFLPTYYDANQAAIFDDDPFQSLDQGGVGRLVAQAIELGRSTRPKLKIGICGEHGGDPDSVQFCHRVGMDYVSCSPFRVPIARLAAAQAMIAEAAAKKAEKQAPAKAAKKAAPKSKSATAKKTATKKTATKPKARPGRPRPRRRLLRR